MTAHVDCLHGSRRGKAEEEPDFLTLELANSLRAMNVLALLLRDQGKFAEAEALCREALRGQRATLGDEHPGTLRSVNNLASLLHDRGKFAEAEPLLLEASPLRCATPGEEHPLTLRSMNNLAMPLRVLGKLA